MNKGKLTLSNGEVITAWQNSEGGLHIGTDDGPIVPDYGDLSFTPDPITELPVGTIVSYGESHSCEKRADGWYIFQRSVTQGDDYYLREIERGRAEIVSAPERTIALIIDDDGDEWRPISGSPEWFEMRNEAIAGSRLRLYSRYQIEEDHGIQEIVYK